MVKRLLRKLLRSLLRLRNKITDLTIYEIKTHLEDLGDFLLRCCQFVIPGVAGILVAMLIYDTGYNRFYSHDLTLYNSWANVLLFMEGLLILRLLLEFRQNRRLRSRLFNGALIILMHYSQNACEVLIGLTPSSSSEYFFWNKVVLYTGTLTVFIMEASQVLRFIYTRQVNPAALFLFSFLSLIGIGALLLMLPKATTQGISMVDAWFTSASAVCVTGLIVVDTATAFTTLGKIILLFLIQLGGLGIMTFAGLLSYLAAGSASFKNQLALKDMLSSAHIGNVFGFIGRVIMVTLFFELIGAILIHSTLNGKLFQHDPEGKIFFAVFHAVSAFCNAGFSTLTNGLYEAPIRFNYSLQVIIAGLVILGGLGFPIVFTLYTFIRMKVMNYIKDLLKIPRGEAFTHIINGSARLALITTFILLVFGFITYLLLEYNASLLQHPTLWGKLVTSFFAAVTPRTAGFNTVDLTVITLPTVMIYLLLMWIGASPGSTGGGIKTTVIAVAFLNLKSIVLGRDRTEFARTQVAETSIHRAFAIILLSLVVLGITVWLLTINDGDKGLFKIAFEAFSAFSTVGLTLGITPELSTFSKFVLTAVMLIGRVGTLTVLFALVSPGKNLYYRYPREEILL